MSFAVHSLIFVCLPLAWGARLLLGPPLELQSAVRGAMRFCLGFGKWMLLVAPLWHLTAMVGAAAPESLSKGVLWLGLLARMLCLHFAFTGLADVLAGLRDLFGIQEAEATRPMPLRRCFTEGSLLRWVGVLFFLSLCGQLIQAGADGFWQQTKALFLPVARTATSGFLEACVWTDFHVLTLIAALASFAGMPHSRDFVRTPAVWKAVLCLLVFAWAAAMFWTHVAPR